MLRLSIDGRTLPEAAIPGVDFWLFISGAFGQFRSFRAKRRLMPDCLRFESNFNTLDLKNYSLQSMVDTYGFD